MDLLKEIFQNVWFERAIWSLVVIFLSLFIYHLISKFLKNKEKRNTKVFSEKKNKTFLRMLRSITAYTLFILTILIVLQIFGVNVSSMLAGVGIASIIIGFALQDALKDIIRGLEIISDSYYDLGDVINYNGISGVVMSIGLRTTKVQDFSTMNIVSISNRNIEQVEIVSDKIYLTVPLPYELSLAAADEILQEITAKIQREKDVTAVDYQGITDLAASSLNFQIEITCDPTLKLPVRRNALRAVIEILEAHHLSVPYQVLDNRIATPSHTKPVLKSAKPAKSVSKSAYPKSQIL